MNNKLKIKLTYLQMDAFIRYISLARDFTHNDSDTQYVTRKLIFDLYARLGRRHIEAEQGSDFTFSITKVQANCICLYVGYLGAVGNTYSNAVVLDVYHKSHQFSA